MTEAAPTPTAPPGHRVGLSSTGVFLISVAIQVIGVAASIVLNRYVGLSTGGRVVIGTVQLYLLLASSVTGIGDLRIGTSYTFYIARGRDPGELTATYLVLRLVMMSIGGIVLFVLGLLPGTGVTFASSSEEIEALGIFLVLPIVWSVQTVYTQLVVAQGRSTAGQIPLLLESLIRTPFIVFATFYDPTILGLTLAYVPGAVASALYCLPRVARETHRFDRREAVELFRYAWPLMGSLVLLYLANNTPPLIVNAYLGTENLTFFSAANGWRILALSLPAAVAVPLFPHLTSLNRREGLDAVRRSTWAALRYTAMIVVPGVLAMIVYRSQLIFIFTNKGYVGPAGPVLAVLALSVIPASLSQIIGTSLSATGYQKLELYLTSVQVGALFGTVVLLLPPLSLWGLPGLVAVGVAIFVSSSAALLLNAFFMLRLLAVQIRLRPVGGIIASAVVAFGAVSQLNRVLAVDRWYELAVALALGFTVYFVVMAVIGELTRDDVRYLLGAVGLPERVRDPVARLCWRESPPPLDDAAPVGLGGTKPVLGRDPPSPPAGPGAPPLP